VLSRRRDICRQHRALCICDAQSLRRGEYSDARQRIQSAEYAVTACLCKARLSDARHARAWVLILDSARSKGRAEFHGVRRARLHQRGITATTPVPVSGLTDVTALAAGFLHTCALRTNGSALWWGTTLTVSSATAAPQMAALRMQLYQWRRAVWLMQSRSRRAAITPARCARTAASCAGEITATAN
jgi:hypothetical protein